MALRYGAFISCIRSQVRSVCACKSGRGTWGEGGMYIYVAGNDLLYVVWYVSCPTMYFHGLH